MRVGSSPMSSGEMSSIAPTTARVCHSSVASPQPYTPGWSVSTLTKIQLRIRALQTRVSMAVIFIALTVTRDSNSCEQTTWAESPRVESCESHVNENDDDRDDQPPQ